VIKLDIINEVVAKTGITKTKAELAVETQQWVHRVDRTKWRVIVIRPAG